MDCSMIESSGKFRNQEIEDFKEIKLFCEVSKERKKNMQRHFVSSLVAKVNSDSILIGCSNDYTQNAFFPFCFGQLKFGFYFNRSGELDSPHAVCCERI